MNTNANGNGNEMISDFSRKVFTLRDEYDALISGDSCTIHAMFISS